jgi:hypothetical protein
VNSTPAAYACTCTPNRSPHDKEMRGEQVQKAKGKRQKAKGKT